VSRPALRDVDAYQRDLFQHELRFVDTQDQPVDVSGAVWLSQVRRRWSDTVVDATFTVDATQAAVGVVKFRLLAATMTGFAPGQYRYDIQWSNYWGAGEPLTVVRGRFTVTGDISRV